MGKNTIIAFALILGIVWFFQSRFYYEQVRKKPYPFQVSQAQQPDSTSAVEKAITERVAITDSAIIPQSIIASSDLPSKKRDDTQRVETVSTGHGSSGDTVWVKTDKMTVGIAERGGVIVSIKMKEYSYRRGKSEHSDTGSLELIPRPAEAGGAAIAIDKDDLSGIVFARADSAKQLSVGELDSLNVVLTGKTSLGNDVEKKYTFKNGTYSFSLAVKSREIIGRNLTVSWDCGIDETEARTGDKSVTQDPRKAHMYTGSEMEHIVQKKPSREERTGSYRWAGVNSKYFLIAFIAPEVHDADVAITGFADSVTSMFGKAGMLNYRFSVTQVCGEPEERFTIYAGPMKLHNLQAQEVQLEKVMYGGWRWFLMADRWFPWICRLVLTLLIGLYRMIPDYGIAIVILTILVKAVTYPLSLSSMKSMSRMKDLQPQMTALRNRYKSDPRKMNEELMALYRKEGVNPFNPGCLPMFLQMPVLFSLYVVLRKAIELRGARTILVPWVQDLSQAEVLFQLPFTIPAYGDNFALMPVVMAVVTFFQNKATMKDPNQMAMVYIMPVMFLVMFNSFPAGLVLYWTLSSVLGVVQQKIIDSQKKPAVQVVVEPVRGSRSKRGKGR